MSVLFLRGVKGEEGKGRGKVGVLHCTVLHYTTLHYATRAVVCASA